MAGDTRKLLLYLHRVALLKGVVVKPKDFVILNRKLKTPINIELHVYDCYIIDCRHCLHSVNKYLKSSKLVVQRKIQVVRAGKVLDVTHKKHQKKVDVVMNTGIILMVHAEGCINMTQVMIVIQFFEDAAWALSWSDETFP